MASNCHIFVQALVILVSLCFNSIKAAPQSSLITSLPGFTGKFPSRHYSGYVPIGDNIVAKKMFYYFVESERNPEKDPVVLWLNGGPGCSSLGGFTYEHGPFTFEASDLFASGASTKMGDLPAKLYLNPNSWSKVSNIIYLESPIGVGFSFSLNESDYETDDLKTAFESHIFLLKFEMFPEYLDNPFYIAGESYAGIYVPTLAFEIVKGVNSISRPIINLKGYMIGNGVADFIINQNAIIPFAYGKGLISNDLYQDIINECDGSYFISNSSSKKCASKIDKFKNVTASLNIYNILDPCYLQIDSRNSCRSCIHGFKVGGDIRKICHDSRAPYLWFNHDAVRKAIHADDEERVSGTWEFCENNVTFHRSINSTLEYHKKLINMGLRVLIYSGDLDMVVPYTGSEAWTRSMGYKIIDEWRPWISNVQVAGYIQGYEKSFTFLTVKGAGHMVPSDKPRETLDFYSRWLAGETI